MTKRLTREILITHDDSAYGIGILELAYAGSEFGEIRILDPEAEESSMGEVVTATRPLS
ncbi:hypothetical protein [Algoriphagus vanfongensis]|uniref:hypothetical protein n=1 Tax=Algoriphagus vanfongensis TaxID=426371 RepID=UPI0003FDC6C0|nr:hypothetical protein [Algoriphagus vanfongensis]